MNRKRLLKYWDLLLLVLFYATLVLLFLRPSRLKFDTPFGGVSLTSAKNIACVFSFAWVAAFCAAPRRYFTRTLIDGPLLLFLAALCLSALFSPYGSAGERGAAVLEFVLYASFFYASLYILRTGARSRGVVRLLVVLAVAVAVFDLAYHYRLGIWLILDQGYPLWDGKNALGLFMVIALSMGASLVVAAPSGGREGRARARLPFLLLPPGLFILLLCLVYSYSRGAWLAAIGAALTFGLMRSWKPIALLTVAIVFLVFMPHKKALNRFRSIPRMSDGNVAKRTAVWKRAATMIRLHPVLGVGPGEFRTAYLQFGDRAPKVGDAKRAKEKTRYRNHAHNLFLQVGAETGLIGLAALLWGMVSVVRLASRRVKMLQQPAAATVKSVIASLVGFLVFSLVDCSWTGRFSGSSFMHINLVVALLIALLAAGNRGKEISQEG